MSKKTLVLNILFFGGLWGLLEATLGYGLQFLPPLVSGSVMFPLAGIIMYWAYRNTGSRKAIIFVAMIAAAIKSLNFMMPGLLPIKTYNPMIAIMLQALVVFALVPLFESKNLVAKFGSLATLAVGWRTLFIVNIAINNALTGFVFQQLASAETILSFVFLYGAMETAFLAIGYVVTKLLNKKINLVFKPHWALALTTMIAALVSVIVPLL